RSADGRDARRSDRDGEDRARAHEGVPRLLRAPRADGGRGRARVGGAVTALDAAHRATLEKILRHPAGGNVEGREVRALLEAVGTTTAEPNGKLKVTLGAETEVLQPPHGKDVDAQMIVDLRRMLTGVGLGDG